MGLRILVDTNVLLDYLLCRTPYEQAAKDIMVACKQRRVYGCIAAHSIPNMFFILRKMFSAEERRKLLWNICNPDSRKRDDEFSPHLAEPPEFY